MRTNKPQIGECFIAYVGEPESTLRNLIAELEQHPRIHRDALQSCRDALDDYRAQAGDDMATQIEEAIDDACVSLTEYVQRENPYLFFGVNPDWPESFGYWVSVETAIEDADLQVDDLCELPTGFTGLVVHVNDHGNVTALNVSRGRITRELFAVV